MIWHLLIGFVAGILFSAVRLALKLGSPKRLVNVGLPGNCNCFMICGHVEGSTPKCVFSKGRQS